MSEAMRKIGDDEPLMIAWKAFLATPEYINARKWAEHMQVTISEGPAVAVQHPHLEGSLWALFMHGFHAGQSSRTSTAPMPEQP